MTIRRKNMWVLAAALVCSLAAVGFWGNSAGMEDVSLAEPAGRSAPVAAPVPPSSLPLGGGCGEYYSIGYGDTVSSYMPPRNAFCYGFEGAAGDVITIRMTRIDGDLDSYLRLWGPQGKVAEDDDSGGDMDSLIHDLSLPATGRYDIVANGLRETSGSFELSLTHRSGCVSIGYDQPVSDYIAPGSVYCYEFTATAGDMITARLTSLDGILDPVLELWGEEGLLIVDDDGGGNRDSLIDSYSLPADGSYRLVAKGYADSTGPFDLVLTSAVQVAPCTHCGEAVTIWTPMPTPMAPTPVPTRTPSAHPGPTPVTPGLPSFPVYASVVSLRGAAVTACSAWSPDLCRTEGASMQVATFASTTAVCLVWSEVGKPMANEKATVIVHQSGGAYGSDVEILRTGARGMSRCIRTQLPTIGGLGEYETTIQMGPEEYVLHWQLAR